MQQAFGVEAIFQRAWHSMLGLVWGDVLGSYFEFKPPSIIKPEQLNVAALKQRNNVYGHGFGHHTDDTALTLAALDAFADYGREGVDLYDRHMRCALAYLKLGSYTAHGHCAAIGHHVMHALRGYELGTPAVNSRESDSGNGFIMRLLPFALVSLLRVPEHRKKAFYTANSAMTHASDTCQEVAWLLGQYLEALLSGDRQPKRPHFRDTTPEAHSPKGYVVGTANLALDAVEQSQSLNETIFACIRHGFDTGTNAAVCGMLAGVVFGVDEVEQESICHLAEIRRLFDLFCEGLADNADSSSVAR